MTRTCYFVVVFVVSTIIFVEQAFAAKEFDSSSNVVCVQGGAVTSSTSVSLHSTIHKMDIVASHWTKLLPGGTVANQHSQQSTNSTTNNLSMSETESQITGGGASSNEFNVSATHFYTECYGFDLEITEETSSAKKECLP